MFTTKYSSLFIACCSLVATNNADATTTQFGNLACENASASSERNTCIGEGAGQSISSGDDNVFVGDRAGNVITSGRNNTVMGASAGIATTTGSDNTFIGANAGYSNVTAVDNTFVGAHTGYANTGADNTFVGTDAGATNTTGSDNTFIGEEAGEFNIDGNDNTFIGENAGQSNTSGSNNTFIGNSAGGDSISAPAAGEGLLGNNNTAVGDESGVDLDGESARNTFLGAAAGRDIGEAFGNTFVGANAGDNSEHGDLNTFIGVGAGIDNNRTNNEDDANRNTAVGALAGFSNREGEDNVWIGAFSGSHVSSFTYNDGITEDMKYSSSSYWYPSDDFRPDGSTTVYRTTVLGNFAGANDDDSISIGFGAISNNTNSIALGTTAKALGNSDLAIGVDARSTHKEAVAIGYQSESHDDYTVTIGNANTIRWDPALDGVTSLGKNKHCYYDDDKKFEWVCDSMYRFSDVVGKALSAVAEDETMVEVNLWADNGDDFADQWSISAENDGDFAIASYVNSVQKWNSQTRVKTDLLSISNTGDTTIAGNLTINSDQRLKTSIHNIENSLELINAIDGKTYYWKPELGRDAKKQVGFIAQNIEAVLPELVTENRRGIKSVNYQGVIPVLVNATKTLSEQNIEQNVKIKKLEQLVEKQQNLINTLIKQVSQ